MTFTGTAALFTRKFDVRNGDTLTRLACGFEIGVTTAWRYVREATDLRAATADDLSTAVNRIHQLAHAILDGTLIPIDRVAERPIKAPRGGIRTPFERTQEKPEPGATRVR